MLSASYQNTGATPGEQSTKNPFASGGNSQAMTAASQPATSQPAASIGQLFGSASVPGANNKIGTFYNGQSPSTYYDTNTIQNANWTGDPLNNLFSYLGQYLTPLLGQQAQFAGQLQEGKQNAIQQFLNQFSPMGQQAQVNAYRNQANQNAGVGAQQAAAQAQSQGLSPAFQAGNTQAAMNNAANQTNQYQAQINSPQYQQQMLSSVLGAYGQGQQIPVLQQLLSMSNPLQEQQQLNMQGGQQGGLLGGLGGILGSFTGGGGIGSLLGMLGLGGGGGGGDAFGQSFSPGNFGIS